MTVHQRIPSKIPINKQELLITGYRSHKTELLQCFHSCLDSHGYSDVPFFISDGKNTPAVLR